MSWDAVKQVLEIGPSSGLTDREFRVLLVLADRLNKRTGQLNPAARRITRDIGLEPTRSAVRSVRRTIGSQDPNRLRSPMLITQTAKMIITIVVTVVGSMRLPVVGAGDSTA